MSVATLALLARPASAEWGGPPIPKEDFGLHSDPVVVTNLANHASDDVRDESGVDVTLPNGKKIFVLLPPTKVDHGTLTVDVKFPATVDAVYTRHDGSIEVTVDGVEGKVSCDFDFDGKNYYFHGNGIVNDANDLHLGWHITDNVDVGLLYEDDGQGNRFRGGEFNLGF